MPTPRSAALPGTPPATATRLLLRGLLRNKSRLAASYGLLSMWQVCEALVPVLIGVIIDRAVATGDWSAVAWWGIALAVLFGVLSYSYRFGARIGFAVVQDEMHRIRVEIAAHALHPRGAKSPVLPGETLSLATADAEMVGQALRSMGFVVAALLSVGGSAWFLFSIDLTLGLTVLIGVPLVLGLSQAVVPVISRRTEKQQETVARATGVATDLVRGLRVLKGIGAASVAARRYRSISQEARTASIHSTSSYGAMNGLTAGLAGIFLAVVALVAGQRALAGDITIGELVAVVGLSQFLAEPIGMLGDISAHTARAHASARRVVAFLRTPHLVPAGSRTPTVVPGRIELRDVVAPGLDRIALTIEPGELVAVATADPAAASSLMALLAGSRQPEQGSLLLDGVPMADLATDARHDHLLVAPHHVDLFEGTLRSNVDPTARLDEERLAALLDASACADVVALVPEGLDQHVTPDGSTFSGGQRQRVALARALAVDAPILVLHDPTTAVDAVTEHRIAAGIRELRSHGAGRRTTVLVTSSPALLAQSDRVLLVADGALVAQGTHHDLAADEAYAELVLR